jgi:formylglycine-generating enzyme required for sulfatase activity
MKTALQNLGFEVTMVQNTDYRSLASTINRFVAKLQSGDVALVYYSGHGLSYNGKNYLLPIDAQLTCLEQLDEHGYSLNKIVGDISVHGVKNSFYLLDACRSVPNLKLCTTSSKDATVPSGLVKPSNNPRGSMIVYATEEGSTADDNVKERNGLFTGALLKFLTKPNLGIRGILDLTTSEVLHKTSDRQSPARYDKLLGDFVFIKSQTPTPQPEVVTPTPSPVKKADLLPYEPEMVFVRGGTFNMGSNDGHSNEKPVHSVTLSDFYMGKTEVTQAQWEAVMGDNPSYFKNCPSCPVEQVSWNDIQIYLEKLNKLTGKSYRLPTEAEWEYAAHGGVSSVGTLYAGANDANTVAWNNSNSSSRVHEVATKKANELGIYDMSGNVWEWCSDWFGSYTASNQTNPTGVSSGTNRVLRGGSRVNDPQYSRVAFRNSDTPDYRREDFGFRVVYPSESK